MIVTSHSRGLKIEELKPLWIKTTLDVQNLIIPNISSATRRHYQWTKNIPGNGQFA